MSEPQQKTFDISSGKIPAGGKIGYIQYALSTTRYVEYLKRLPKLTFNTSYKGMYDTLSKIYMVNSSGNDMIYAVQQSRELAWNQLEAIKRFDESEILDVIDFCALFINFENEDVSKYDHAMHESKKVILSEEGYDASLFFQLQVNLIEGFSQSFQLISKLSQGDQVDIRLRENIEQI